MVDCWLFSPGRQIQTLCMHQRSKLIVFFSEISPITMEIRIRRTSPGVSGWNRGRWNIWQVVKHLLMQDRHIVLGLQIYCCTCVNMLIIIWLEAYAFSILRTTTQLNKLLRYSVLINDSLHLVEIRRLQTARFQQSSTVRWEHLLNCRLQSSASVYASTVCAAKMVHNEVSKNQ